ncbi:MAG: YggT family protein [Firmicutes bacterium]|uniref:YggT family protein n=1 Tax=Melghirimyces thermohalophilus TaxID=1236220 RepID=A0A1G6HRI8_9BACL|nr:YggT family protein [Melghirimyces thermohalophilus]MDA8354431.1 YggT family protein [Bacillota bacterium]SDB96917.1 YggT family protein [Melghirimyces thermohalophilus]
MIYEIVHTLFTIYRVLIFGYILLSWFPQGRESPVALFLARVVEPYLTIFRSFIPPLGMIDISPIVALIALSFIEQGVYFVLNLLLGVF